MRLGRLVARASPRRLVVVELFSFQQRRELHPCNLRDPTRFQRKHYLVFGNFEHHLNTLVTSNFCVLLCIRHIERG